jgi:predicted permease
MRWINLLGSRLRGLLHSDQVINEIEEEMRFHLDMETQTNIDKGITPNEARLIALRSFGNLSIVRDRSYDIRGGGMLETLMEDIRFGLRMLAKHIGFTSVALVTLALAIGANTAIFSVIKGVLLWPLPYTDSERVVRIWNTFPPLGLMELEFSEPEFIQYRKQIKSLDHIGAFSTGAQSLTGAGDAERITMAWASADVFSVLGTRPVLGRVFTAEEDQPGNQNVVLISHRLWQEKYGGDSGFIGKSITINGTPRTVIGIMPATFKFPSNDIDVWTPIAVNPASANIGSHYMGLVGHLAPGATLEQASAEMRTVHGSIKQRFPEYFKGADGSGVNVIPLREQIVGNVRGGLLVLFGAVCFILLIACANIANLLLSRAASRQKEIAVRAALGASRTRIVRQLLTESIMLSILGGGFGFLLSLWALRLIVTYSPLEVIPRLHEVNIDSVVFGFTLLVSTLTGCIFGLAPALRSSKPNLTETLKEGGRGGAGSLRRNRTRSLLVVAEVALSLMLLIGAGMMVKSFLHLMDVKLGYDTKQALTMRLSLSPTKYPGPQQVVSFYQQLLQRIAGLPGVQTAAAVNQLPLDGARANISFEIEGRELQPGTAVADDHLISPDYFRALNIPLMRGRFFTELDGKQGPPVVIINQTLAERFWPGEDPIGKQMRIRRDAPPVEIVGIVANVKNRKVNDETKPELYFPLTESSFSLAPPSLSMALIVRTSTDPPRLTNTIRSAIRDTDAETPVADILTMENIVSKSISEPRFVMALMVIFAAMALVLMAIGVYGVVSHSVTLRTQEIGIRKALGATPRDITMLVIRQGLLLALSGIAIGLIGAFALARVITGLLYNVSATDPAIFVGISLLLIVVAMLACYVPARRAMKVDPMITLRYE